MKRRFILCILLALLGSYRSGLAAEVDWREVTFPSDGMTLEGTLTWPKDKQGPHPAVVMLHGSGPQSRDGNVPGQINMSFGFEMDVLRQVAQSLTRAGFAVLRYDKRTCNAQNNCSNSYDSHPEATAFDFVQDALAALDFLKAQPEANASRLALVGHSQGGGLVPYIMNQRPEIHAGVLLAANYDPIDDIIALQRDHSRTFMEELGFSEQDIATALTPVESLLQNLRAMRQNEYAETAPVGGGTPAFWHSMYEVADQTQAVAPRLDRPLLVIAGEYDWNVPVSQADLWEKALRGAKAPHRVVRFSCVTHGLNCVSEPNPRNIQPQHIGRRVDARILDVITTFLREDH